MHNRFSAKPTVLRSEGMEAYFTSLRDRQPVGLKAAAGGGGGSVLQVGGGARAPGGRVTPILTRGSLGL